MTIVAAREYNRGKVVRDGEAVLADPRALPDTQFAWVGLKDPTAEELKRCADRFNLHPLAVEDALHAHQLPKLEVYGE